MSNRTDDLLDLFMHPGWKEFRTEMEEALQQFKETTHMAKTAEEFFYRKGQIQQLASVCNYELIIKAQANDAV